jgi:hypothetical protein
MTNLNLGGVTSANDLLKKVGAEQVLVLLQRLGFWVAGNNPITSTPHAFPKDLSKLDSDHLGDECSYWQSELSRVIAIIGALESQKLVASFELKRAQNAITARLLRANQEDGKKPITAVALNSAIATAPEVQSPEEALLVIEVSLTALESVKTALEGYTRVLSREISRRGDLLRGGITR